MGMTDLNSYSNRILFPFKQTRKYQQELIQTIHRSATEGVNLLVQAPTGLGKTISALAAMLPVALKQKKKLFFLTSRTTQHEIVLESLHAISEEFKIKIPTISITSKKEVCPFHEETDFSIADFSRFCARAKETGTCPYYERTYKEQELTQDAHACIRRLEQERIVSYRLARNIAAEFTVCPYEILIALAQDAQVIICDYNYVFNPGIRKLFFSRTKSKLEHSMIIIDETHNLPDRITGYQTKTITTATLSRLVEQLQKFNEKNALPLLRSLFTALFEAGKGISPYDKQMITRETFNDILAKESDYSIEDMVDVFETADEILQTDERNDEQVSLGRIIAFLELWDQELDSHARIISHEPDQNNRQIKLTCKSLDPREISSQVIEDSYVTVGMSATLKPIEMYRDILGFPQETTRMQGFPSPFPKENNCSLIVPNASTQYKTRSVTEYKKIATIASTIINTVPGNTIVFYPSYELLRTIKNHLTSEKEELFESSFYSKVRKRRMLNEFKKNSTRGVALHAVIGGSFSEGIDLPGDFVKCVLIIGLPFARPDLEIKAQISYYQHLFGKGMDYAYIFPALNKVVQSAGRCIRSDTDKGLII
jgi:DNA excision repair protein ERCC-2